MSDNQCGKLGCGKEISKYETFCAKHHTIMMEEHWRRLNDA